MARPVAFDAVLRARAASDAVEDVRRWLPEAHARDEAMIRESAAVGAMGASGVNRRSAATTEADRERERGNDAYKRGEYARAIERYDASVAVGETAAAYANRAMCWLKLEEWASAEVDCSRALELDVAAFGVKAYQRRGTARREMGKYMDSVMDFEEALRLEPTSKILKEERAKSQRAFELEEKIRPTQTRTRIRVDDDEQANGDAMDVDRGDTRRDVSSADDGRRNEREIKVKSREPPAPSGRASSTSSIDAGLVDRATAIAASKPIVAPRNGAEFERSYRREMKSTSSTSLARRAELLALVPAAAVTKMFAGGLEPDVLADVTTVALAHWLPTAFDTAVDWLERLPSTSRFAVSVALRPPHACPALTAAFAAAAAATADDLDATRRILALRRAFDA